MRVSADASGGVGVAQRSRCAVCKKSGGTVGCQDGRCKATFHIACAVREGCGCVQAEYRIWCPRHHKSLPAIQLAPLDERGAAAPADPPPPSTSQSTETAMSGYLAKLNRWREVGSPGSSLHSPHVKVERTLSSPPQALPPPTRAPAVVVTPHQQHPTPLAELDSHEFSPMLRVLLATPPAAATATSPDCVLDAPRPPANVTAAVTVAPELKPAAPSPLPIGLMKGSVSPVPLVSVPMQVSLLVLIASLIDLSSDGVPSGHARRAVRVEHLLGRCELELASVWMRGERGDGSFRRLSRPYPSDSLALSPAHTGAPLHTFRWLDAQPCRGARGGSAGFSVAVRWWAVL
jgi:hypothetical protein